MIVMLAVGLEILVCISTLEPLRLVCVFFSVQIRSQAGVS